MPVNLSVKNVPDALAAKLRERAERNHRSLQGELMAILEAAAFETRAAAAPADGLLERLLAIAGSRGIETTKRLTRERAHDRKLLRKSGV
jgi:plasmid stability protein